MNTKDKRQYIALLSDKINKEDNKGNVGNKKPEKKFHKGNTAYMGLLALCAVSMGYFWWQLNQVREIVEEYGLQDKLIKSVKVGELRQEPVAGPSAPESELAANITNNAERKPATSIILDASGYVTARRMATVSSKVLGKISKLYVEEGDVVSEGQVLAQLDNTTELIALKLAEVSLNKSKLKAEEIRVKEQEALVKLKYGKNLQKKSYISEEELITLQASYDSYKASLETQLKEIVESIVSVDMQKQQLKELVIKSPFAGTIISKNAQVGEIVSPSSAGGGFTRTGIYTLVDMKSLEIEVDVSEKYIYRLSPGTKATAVLDAFPDYPIPAEVITIVPTADRSKETVKVRVRFLKEDERILPEMAVRVKFISEQEA